MRKILIAALLLSTGVAYGQQTDRDKQFEAAFSACSHEPGTWLERVRCASAADNRIYGQETALMAWKHAQWQEIGLKVDRRELTTNQANDAMQKVRAEVLRRSEATAQQQQAIRLEAAQREAERRALIDVGKALGLLPRS